MHAEELRQAVTKVVDILKRSDIRIALDRYRSARGEERTVAAARLGHAGAMIMERMQGLSAAERRVVRLMHLEPLGTTAYWETLLDGEGDPKVRQGEIVRLASRVMFATGQLPVFAALLDAGTGERAQALADGEASLVIRLADAGEKASDPDRVARSIDGVDMLYSACASIARKPAMDLRLESIDGARHRDLRFVGERDSLTAVVAVIESIPAALADIDPDGDIDLEAIVGSLPVFEDLETLASLGTFSNKDLKDIRDTMHQGALLVLESGVVLVEGPGAESAASAAVATARSAPASAPRAAATASATAPAQGTADAAASAAAPDADAAGGGDDHYERYLREREAMQRSAAASGGTANGAVSPARRDAVEELLRSLHEARNG